MKKIFINQVWILLFLNSIITISLAQTNSVNSDLPEGTKAKDIDGIDTAGISIPLYTLKSDITILYFYDFECRFCDSATLSLIELYHHIKNKNIEVYALPLSDDLIAWKNYISKYHLDWINVIERNKEEKIRDNYHLNATPTIYVIDRKKIISSKRIVFTEDVGKVLKEKFKID